MSQNVVRVGGVEPSLTLHARRGRQVALVLGALAFVVAGALIAAYGDAEDRWKGAVAAVVFGVFGVLGTRLALRPGPALVVDRTGITDRSSATPAGFVPWSEITGLGTWGHRGQQFVTVGVADPGAVLARVHPWARPALRASMRLSGTPVNIATVALPMTGDELVRELAAFAPRT